MLNFWNFWDTCSFANGEDFYSDQISIDGPSRERRKIICHLPDRYGLKYCCLICFFFVVFCFVVLVVEGIGSSVLLRRSECRHHSYFLLFFLRLSCGFSTSMSVSWPGFVPLLCLYHVPILCQRIGSGVVTWYFFYPNSLWYVWVYLILLTGLQKLHCCGYQNSIRFELIEFWFFSASNFVASYLFTEGLVSFHYSLDIEIIITVHISLIHILHRLYKRLTFFNQNALVVASTKRLWHK